MQQKVECRGCGELLPSEWANSTIERLCPKCGSKYKNVTIEIIEDSIEIKESLTGKTKDKRFNSKKNPRNEFFQGADQRKTDGKWMEKNRVIDKNNDRYFEEVVDPDTGEIIHYCDEPLSDHFGHGSAEGKDQ